MNESSLHDGFLKKDRIKKFVFKKKLETIEGRYLASIWKCFDQHYIGESIEMFNLMLQFPLILQWNAEQNMSRSMPGSNLQLVVSFCSSKFCSSLFYEKTKVPTSDVVFFTKIKNLGKRDEQKIFRRMNYFRSSRGIC